MSVEYFIILGIGAMFLLVISFLFAVNISQRKKLQYHKDVQALHDEQKRMLLEQNTILEQKVSERTSELFQQKQVLEQTLDELKSTQAQLIHREKLASLGELTAGIAHEIQNPLNFINNFSEINKELVHELTVEKLKPITERNEKVEEELLDNIRENEEKINHHGSRADAIVKGMLLHSRSSAGEKELTDINALADEFLKLSYHGLRAKDKNFCATIVTGFDDTIDKINAIPQEIGRVLLNLYNNAFYAVTEKKKLNLKNIEHMFLKPLRNK